MIPRPLPSISLKNDQIACCPSCNRKQSDPVKDYFAAKHIGSTAGLVDRCEWCDTKLRFVCLVEGIFEIHALESIAAVDHFRTA